ncbi:MAG: TrbG/VirB9 family P-type conjugative transfer protein [Brevundimonas sp.]
MTAVALALSAALAAAFPPSAQTAPDPRMRELAYAPGEVYRIPGAFRTATQIIFSPQETIRHAAIGDSVAWEVAAEGSVLFLKPRERHQATNLLVVTDRGGETRHYAFELTARDPGDRGPIAYQVRFRYPADERAAAAAALSQAAEAAETRLIGLALHQAAIEGPRNLAWSVQGDAALQPSEVSDNGRFTVLRFPGVQALPALFEIGEDGQERLVPYDVRGEFVVVHGLVRGLRLRRGKAVLCLFNEAFDDRAAAAAAGTASAAVERSPAGDRP